MSEQFYEANKVPDDGLIPFEELFERHSRELALKLACNAGNERCLSDTFNVNKHFIEDGHNVPKGLEGVVLCNGFRGTGKQVQWSALYNQMQTTTDSTLKSQIRAALGCTDDADSLLNYLRSTVADGNTYTQSERQNILSATLNSQSGLSTVLSFINDFESDILRLFGYATLEDLLNVPARTIKNPDQQTIFVEFLDTLTNLEGVNATRITAIVDNNFAVQRQVQYTKSMDFIREYLAYHQTDPTQAPTDPTQAPTEPTQAPTEPTEAPTEPTQAPTEPTTPSSGAVTISLRFATLFAGILMLFA